MPKGWKICNHPQTCAKFLMRDDHLHVWFCRRTQEQGLLFFLAEKILTLSQWRTFSAFWLEMEESLKKNNFFGGDIQAKYLGRSKNKLSVWIWIQFTHVLTMAGIRASSHKDSYKVGLRNVSFQKTVKIIKAWSVSLRGYCSATKKEGTWWALGSC